jgi:hypothetical protein
MKKKLYLLKALIGVIVALGCATPSFAVSNAQSGSHLQQRLEAMFSRMVVKKDISKMPVFYDRHFVLYSNGSRMSYKRFYRFHAEEYQTGIQYRVRYDHKTIVSAPHRLAERLFISFRMPGKQWKKLQVNLIAVYRKNKIYRLYELTYPNWQRQAAFKRKR